MTGEGYMVVVSHKEYMKLWKKVVASYPETIEKSIHFSEFFKGCEPDKINGRDWIFSKEHSHLDLRRSLIKRYI
jgi:hypothetical protein